MPRRVRAKISDARRRYLEDDIARSRLREAARKGGQAHRGLKRSQETKDRIGAAHKGVPETYYARFMYAIGQAERHRSRPTDTVKQAFYDGLVAMHGEGEVMREVPFGPYIVDFYVPKLHLAYELDGWQHERLYLDSDRQRDAWLLQFAGLPVSRVKRSEVEAALQAA